MDRESGSNSDSQKELRNIVTSSSIGDPERPLVISGTSSEGNKPFPNTDAAAGPSRIVKGTPKGSCENNGQNRRGSTDALGFDADAVREENESFDKQTSKTLDPLANPLELPVKCREILNHTLQEAPEYIGYYVKDNTPSNKTPLVTHAEDARDVAPDEPECMNCHRPDEELNPNQGSNGQSRARSSVLIADPGSTQIEGTQSSKPLKRASQGESQWSEGSDSTPQRSRRQTLRDSIGAMIRSRPSLPELWRRISPDRSVASAPKAEPKLEPRDDLGFPNDKKDGYFCDALVGLMRRREQARIDEQNLRRENRHSI